MPSLSFAKGVDASHAVAAGSRDIFAIPADRGSKGGSTLTCTVDYTAHSAAAQNITATYSGDVTHSLSFGTFQLNGHGGHGGGSSFAPASSPTLLLSLLIPAAAIGGMALSGRAQLKASAIRKARSLQRRAPTGKGRT